MPSTRAPSRTEAPPLRAAAARACTKAAGSVTDSPGTTSEPSASSSASTPLARAFSASSRDRFSLTLLAWAQARAAAQHLHPELAQQALAQLGRAKNQACLHRSRLGVEARVQDPRVGPARLEPEAGIASPARPRARRDARARGRPRSRPLRRRSQLPRRRRQTPRQAPRARSAQPDRPVAARASPSSSAAIFSSVSRCEETS